MTMTDSNFFGMQCPQPEMEDHIIKILLKSGLLEACLEIHLEQFEMSVTMIGMTFLTLSVPYFFASPLWGYVCDHHVAPDYVQVCWTEIGFSTQYRLSWDFKLTLALIFFKKKMKFYDLSLLCAVHRHRHRDYRLHGDRPGALLRHGGELQPGVRGAHGVQVSVSWSRRNIRSVPFRSSRRCWASGRRRDWWPRSAGRRRRHSPLPTSTLRIWNGGLQFRLVSSLLAVV